MSKRFPEWVNTQVVIKAIKMREEGMILTLYTGYDYLRKGIVSAINDDDKSS